MIIYATSRNTGPSYSSDPVFLVYLGTSLEEAEAKVGAFSRYERESNSDSFISSRCALPNEIEWKVVKYYMADGWWYSIVSFELTAPIPEAPSYAGSDDAYMYTDGPLVGHVTWLPHENVGNYKVLHGGKLSKEEFPELWKVMSQYPWGRDETTFTIPDLRARVIEKEES